MRTTLEIDDALFARAQACTGLGDPSAVVHEALRALVGGECARLLSRLGGSEPDLGITPRRRRQR
jgi:Arc/MetJ family transcription regulator